jgi:hypothetical protein
MVPRTLLEWVVRWCSLPHMFLATPSTQGQADLHNLILLLTGFECGDARQEAHEEWRQFTLWLGERRPDLFREGLSWFGEGLLIDCNNDHAQAAERLKAYVQEYQAWLGGSSGQR